MNTLIALGGALRSGKGEVARRLESQHDFVTMGMSDPLNLALTKIGPAGPWVKIDHDIIISKPWETTLRRGKLHAGEHVRYQDLLSAVGYVGAKKHRDVREYLQGLGTEVGREMIGENTWTDIAISTIKNHWAEGRPVVIDGIRFPNELAMVTELGGILVWVERSASLRGAPEGTEQHASETSVRPGDFDFVLMNNTTLDKLYEQADAMVTAALASQPTHETLEHVVASRDVTFGTQAHNDELAEKMIAGESEESSDRD